MTGTVLLVPPDKEGYMRDTYYGCWHKRKFVRYAWPPLMLYYLHAQIPDSTVLDSPTLGLDADATLAELRRLSPDHLVTNAGTYTIDDDAPFLTRVKQEVGSTTILFGEYATTNTPAAVHVADYVIRGEPENVVPSLIRELDSGQADKIPFVNTKDSISTEKHLVKKLDDLPFPRRILDERDNYFNPFARRGPFATALATRGCPYDCVFCTVPALYGKSFRIRSAKNVADELMLLEEQGYREVFFRDENLTLHRRFLMSLCEEIEARGIDITWMSNSRVDSVDEDLLSKMRDAGCHLLKFGVESFSDETLLRIKKGATVSQIKDAFRICRYVGIETVAHMILGNPGEDERAIWSNVEELLRVDPTYASFDVVLTYAGTELASLEQSGHATAIAQEKLEEIHDKAFRRFYLRPKFVARHMGSIKSAGELGRKAVASMQLWKGLIRGSS